MKNTTQLELRSLVTSTESQASAYASDAHSEGLEKPLRQSSPSWLRRVGFAIPLLTIPIAYAILLAIMFYLHGKEQNSFGDTILEVISVASTLWPILFAAVLGPLLKTIALFRAERGSTLGSLEFLLTSQTTASALKNFTTMGWIGSWTVVILIVWSLSPLGGQAALRSLHLQQNLIRMKAPATYYLGNNKSEIYNYYRGGASVFTGGSSAASLVSDMRTMMSASFSSQDILVSHANRSSPHYNDTISDLGGKWEASRSGRRDLWRNVRIPFIELLPGYRSDDPNAWISVPDDEVVPYASLIGLPIRNGSFERSGNSTMTVHFHYITLSCGRAFDGSEWVSKGSTALSLHNTSLGVPLAYQYLGMIPQNMGNPNIWFDFPRNPARSEHANWQTDLEPQSKLQLVMGGQCERYSKVTPILTVCDISTSYIDMEITCNRLAVDADLVCQANRVRHMPSFPIKGNLTALSNFRLSGRLLWELPFIGVSHHVAESSVLEMYLRDPLGVFQRVMGGYTDDPNRTIQPGCFASLPPEILGRRLATALNTVVMSTYELNVLTGGRASSLDGEQARWQNTTASWTEFDRDTYALRKPWFITTIVSTVILMVCAIGNIIIRQLIRAPDFLDNIAGFTRDSPYFGIPQKGSGKSGFDRLETIKNIRVRICDVYPEREVGRIALTTEVNGPKLRWERSYL